MTLIWAIFKLRCQVHAASVTGPRHLNEQQVNQDAILRRCWSKQWLVVVSDGMGSRPHADIGAQQACLAVCASVQRSSFDRHERELIQEIYQNWLWRLSQYSPLIHPKDAAATCLFAWGRHTGETRLFQLGDGAIFYQTEIFGKLVTRDAAQFSNETTALGISKKWSDWSYSYIKLYEPNHSIALMSDGISDDLIDEEGFLAMLGKRIGSKSPRQGKRWMQRELNNWKTPQHSDDKSLGFVYWMA